MKYNDNGTYKDIYVKSFDTLPVGTEVDYDGNTVPDGWIEVDDPNVYSTPEMVVGTWTDGKPIYRQIFTGETSTGTGLIAIITVTDIKNIIKADGFANRSDNENISLYIVTDKVAIQKSNANQVVIYFNNDVSYKFTYNLILYYTKTTD